MSTVNTHSESDEFEVSEDLYLPVELREELSRQYQPIVSTTDIVSMATADGADIVAVGDMVCHTLIADGALPKITIFDFRTRRADVPADWKDVLLSTPGARLKIRSPNGVLSRELWEALKLAWEFPGSTKIIVEGEEDLAGLASIYLMTGALVVYGLPGVGMTVIKSDEGARDTALSILRRMIPVSRLKSM